MRSTSGSVNVRLYLLDGDVDGGATQSLFYGPLDEALKIAAAQSNDVQNGLFIATDNDVVGYLDFIES